MTFKKYFGAWDKHFYACEIVENNVFCTSFRMSVCSIIYSSCMAIYNGLCSLGNCRSLLLMNKSLTTDRSDKISIE